ncbi:NAD(P)H-dependent oxidoreductase [bacterium]|nr:NAD(P)H-dependent oxidoreductase [bacterium]
MKTFIVKYLPSGENSNTKKLYDHLKSKIDLNDIEEFDLIKDNVPMFKEDSVTAYYLRNFLGKELSDSQKLAIHPFDEIVRKVQNAERLIFVFPMHNFSLPGIVKMFFDSFMLNGELFNINDESKKQQVLNKQIIVLYSHGGEYPVGSDFEKYDFVRSLLTQEFSFMGFKDYSFISYSTADPAKREMNLEEAIKKIDQKI